LLRKTVYAVDLGLELPVEYIIEFICTSSLA